MNWAMIIETGEWIGMALLAGCCLLVWGAYGLLRWSRPKTRTWNGKEII